MVEDHLMLAAQYPAAEKHVVSTEQQHCVSEKDGEKSWLHAASKTPESFWNIDLKIFGSARMQRDRCLAPGKYHKLN